MQTKFTLYSGLNTIGGVIASVTYGNDRVIFEMGSAYDPKTDVFDGTVEVRKVNGIKDKMKLGMLPQIDGIYRETDIPQDSDLISAENSPYQTAVFISHLHLDHMAFMGMVSPNVTVYLHQNAQKIEQALQTIGEGVETTNRDYTHFEPYKPITVGNIEVLPILTSTASYYNFSFLITTPDGTIHWTGDLSLHGKENYLTFKQIEILKEKDIDVLLCDCTTFMDSTMKMIYGTTDPSVITPSKDVPKHMLSDEQLDKELFSILEKQTGLCVINFYPREVDRAMLFIEWAKKTKRVCAFEPDTAYILYKFFQMQPVVYIPDSWKYATENTKQVTWYTELMDNCRIVTIDDINENPYGYLVQNSYQHILELLDFPGGTYLHADGIPIGEFDPAYENMMRVIQKTNFTYVTFFCKNHFGHGYPSQVKYFVDEVNPKILIPCHSFNPERLLPKDGKQLLPILNKTYILQNGNLIEEIE